MVAIKSATKQKTPEGDQEHGVYTIKTNPPSFSQKSALRLDSFVLTLLYLGTISAVAVIGIYGYNVLHKLQTQQFDSLQTQLDLQVSRVKWLEEQLSKPTLEPEVSEKCVL